MTEERFCFGPVASVCERFEVCDTSGVRPVIAPNERVHGEDGRVIHLIRTDGPTAYQFALERPLCRKGRGPTIWDPANMWDLDERTLCAECARRAAR